MGGKDMTPEARGGKTDSSQTPQSICQESEGGIYLIQVVLAGVLGKNKVLVHMSTRAFKLMNMIESDTSEWV